MNAQHLLCTTTQTIVNNHFLNGNVDHKIDILEGRFKKTEFPVYGIYLSMLVNVRVSYSFIVFLQRL